jgi:hypothetical protein
MASLQAFTCIFDVAGVPTCQVGGTNQELFIQSIPAAYGAPNQGQGDQAFMLMMTALVFIMTPGVAFYYGGLVGSNAVVNTMMLSFGTIGVTTIAWVIIGYSLAFGPVAIPSIAMNIPIGYATDGWNFADAAPQATATTAYVGNSQLAFLAYGSVLRQNGWAPDGKWDTPGATPTYWKVTENVFMVFQLMFANITIALIRFSPSYYHILQPCIDSTHDCFEPKPILLAAVL